MKLEEFPDSSSLEEWKLEVKQSFNYLGLFPEILLHQNQYTRVYLLFSILVPECNTGDGTP